MFGMFKKTDDSQLGLAVYDSGTASRASIFAMHIMALADGEIAPEEREAMIEITSSFKRGLLAPEEILDLVDETQRLVASGGEAGWEHLFKTMSPIHRTDQFFIMHTAFTFAIIDGDFHAREQRLLSLIASWMGMKQKDLKLFASQADQRIADARAQGHTITIDHRDWRVT